MSFVETEINGQIITIRLNRPERLSNLADLNFIKLKLVPLAAQHFTELEVIPMSPRRSLVVSSPVLVSSDGGKQFP